MCIYNEAKSELIYNYVLHVGVTKLKHLLEILNPTSLELDISSRKRPLSFQLVSFRPMTDEKSCESEIDKSNKLTATSLGLTRRQISIKKLQERLTKHLDTSKNDRIFPVEKYFPVFSRISDCTVNQSHVLYWKWIEKHAESNDNMK